ncbi:MAG: PqqD family protein [Theionarchaea archaeon]|nr:PqqD family protein [Theionarchaea archaeon]MBU7001929.1 PqqD family protein [Theionarchaea archaeon]MBU7020416.1 PqqD family protein [Theionarchaea archaeon]MBU7041641.1 PqqD family protein [Theionarchaea archaeon]
MEDTAKPKRVAHVRPREQGDDLALFNVMTAQYFVVNEVGREIWNQCTGDRTIREIAQEIHTTIEGAPSFDEVLADTIELIEDLKNKSLVTV